MADMYPSKIYPQISQQWPSRQFVGQDSQISGDLAGGIASVTETWETGGTGAPNQGRTSPAPGNLPSSLQMYYDVAQYMYGFPTSKGNGQGIARQLPSQHPELTDLFCMRIANVKGIGANGMTTNNVAAWKIVRFDATWETPKYQIFSDAVTANLGAGDSVPNPGEQYRFLVPDFDPAVQFLQRPQAAFIWPQVVLQNLKINAAPITNSGGESLRLIKRHYSYTWVQVPDVGLFNGRGFMFGGLAVNVEAALGCVNADTFLGFPPGTLLFESWKINPTMYPQRTLNANGGGIVQNRTWDVKLKFTLFTPPTNPNDPAQNTPILIGGKQYNVKTGGHHCAPAQDGYWYRPYLQYTSADGGQKSDDTGGPQVGNTAQQIYWKHKYWPFWTIFTMCA